MRPGARADEPTVEVLVRGLDDLARGPAAQALLIALGERAIEPLGRFLLAGPSLHPQPRMLAAEALGCIGGPRASRALLEALLAGDPRTLPPVLRLSEEARVAMEPERPADRP
jgi:HEAT repeat protein